MQRPSMPMVCSPITVGYYNDVSFHLMNAQHNIDKTRTSGQIRVDRYNIFNVHYQGVLGIINDNIIGHDQPENMSVYHKSMKVR